MYSRALGDASRVVLDYRAVLGSDRRMNVRARYFKWRVVVGDLQRSGLKMWDSSNSYLF